MGKGLRGRHSSHGGGGGGWEVNVVVMGVGEGDEEGEVTGVGKWAGRQK